MRAVLNFVRHPLLGVLSSTLVGFLLLCCGVLVGVFCLFVYFLRFFCYPVVSQCSSPGCGAEHHVLQFVLLCSFLRERGKNNCWICLFVYFVYL